MNNTNENIVANEQINVSEAAAPMPVTAKTYVCDEQYAREKKTYIAPGFSSLFQSLCIIAAIIIVAVIVVLFKPLDETTALPVVGVVLLAVVISLVQRFLARHKTAAWFRSFVEFDGQLWALRFYPIVAWGRSSSWRQRRLDEECISAAQNPAVMIDVVNTVKSGVKLRSTDYYRKVTAKPLENVRISSAGKVMKIKHNGGKLTVADCYPGLIECIERLANNQ